MESYASNQFFNFGKGYEIGKSLKRQPDDNPNFIWPRPVQPDIYNPIRGKQVVDTRFQRGFIRGIYPAVLGNTPNTSASKVKQRRLFFQFNPETIDRTVSMNSMVANPLLQDPAQLYQPIAGTAAFSFELLFNREAEVVSAMYATDQISNGGFATDTANPLTKSLDNYGSNTNWGDVASLGVLADMYILDSIIGQSITPDMKDFLSTYWKNASNVSKSYAANGTGASVGFNDKGFETNIEKNYGNAAFLSPLPIRIVFSSMFMVEGFVETSSVQFVKFSKNYVPTICKVSLQIRALYIGFAKEEAYLTTSLKTAVKDMEAQARIDGSTAAAADDIAKYGINFEYSSPSLYKEITGQLIRNITNYSTFADFYNDGTAVVGADWANLQFEGSIKSWVSPAAAKKIADGEITWDFSGKFVMEEMLPNQQTKVLAQGNITYLTDSKSKQLTTTEVATETNKATTKASARKHKYYAVPFNIDQQSFAKTMTNAINPVKVTITHIVNVTCTTSSGTQVVTRTFTEPVTISSFAQWLVFHARGTIFKFPKNPAPTVNWKDR
jgi:hypothetical protein